MPMMYLASGRPQHKGKSFPLSFRSANCTHCPTVLKALGELSRTYLYNGHGTRLGRSGVQAVEHLEQWITEHVK